MLGKLYEHFILDCIKYLEENPLYSEKLKRLKKLAKVQSGYLAAVTEALLDFFYRNDHYSDVSRVYNEREEENVSAMIDGLLKRYEKRCETYLFDVSVDGYEGVFFRTIQVPHDATLGTLGLAVIAALGGQDHEFYISHGIDGLYPAYFDQQLHFTESDPFEICISGFTFGNDRMEMSYCGLTIGIEPKEVQCMEDIYVPQSYRVLGGAGLDLCVKENKPTFSAKIIQSECTINVPMDINREVKEGLMEWKTRDLIPGDTEWNEDDEYDE